jgi:hypothetical protein
MPKKKTYQKLLTPRISLCRIYNPFLKRDRLVLITLDDF